MMNTSFSRADRVAAQVKRELALLIRERVNDPRARMVSVLDVQISKDFAYAKVWFDVLEEEQGADAEEALNHASGFLRRELGRKIKLRVTPELRFFYDNTQSKGNALSVVIDQAVASDRVANEREHDAEQKP